jgi:hypothetical protein
MITVLIYYFIIDEAFLLSKAFHPKSAKGSCFSGCLGSLRFVTARLPSTGGPATWALQNLLLRYSAAAPAYLLAAYSCIVVVIIRIPPR